MQALRKEPEWRYQTAADLRDDITRFLEGRPILDLPDPPHVPHEVGFNNGEFIGCAADEVDGHQPA